MKAGADSSRSRIRASSSIPLGFFGAVLGTLLRREPEAERKFTELSVRANTGLGVRSDRLHCSGVAQLPTTEPTRNHRTDQDLNEHATPPADRLPQGLPRRACRPPKSACPTRIGAERRGAPRRRRRARGRERDLVHLARAGPQHPGVGRRSRTHLRDAAHGAGRARIPVRARAASAGAADRGPLRRGEPTARTDAQGARSARARDDVALGRHRLESI